MTAYTVYRKGYDATKHRGSFGRTFPMTAELNDDAQSVKYPELEAALAKFAEQLLAQYATTSSGGEIVGVTFTGIDFCFEIRSSGGQQ